MTRKIVYDQVYIRKCFDAWYLAGRPNTPAAIKTVIPTHESGRIPSTATVNKWVVQGFWDVQADDLDAKAMQLADENVIQKKAEMLRVHQQQAYEVTLKALEHIRSEGFDSSSAAVKAFFDGMQEQRKVAGFSDLLEKLDKMTNNDVEKEIISLLNRASDNDQVIETEVEDVPQI
jgi:hypothetical protein